MTTWRLLDGIAGRPGAGSSGTQPPVTGTSLSGNIEFGMTFKVPTSWGAPIWATGFWWWCANTGQDTTPVQHGLWQMNGNTGNLPSYVTGTKVTSGTLTAGAWNFTALPSPVLLTPGGPYIAAVAYAATAGYPGTTHQFGGSDPYPAGISNGPLFAYPSKAALAFSQPQQSYVAPAAIDTSLYVPFQDNLDDLFWIDIQVTDTPPGPFAYRAFPSLPAPWSGAVGTGTYTLGTQFRLSQPCRVLKLWHYSPAGTGAQLPTECGIWKESDQTLAAGTHQASPSWLGPSGTPATAGDGWVYADYSGGNITLPAADYRVSTFCSNGGSGGGTGNPWFSFSYGYWSGDFAQNLGQGGITAGPLYVPDVAAATAPGQSLYDDTGIFAYPDIFNTGEDGENHWIDLEVTPATVLPAATYSVTGRTVPRLTEAFRFSR